MANYTLPSETERVVLFRVFQDNVSLNGASPIAAQDTPAQMPWNTQFRVRMRVTRDIDCPSRYYLIEYRVGDSGTWRACDVGETVYIELSEVFTDGEGTTERLVPGMYQFGGGEGIETRRSSQQYTQYVRDYELEWNLRIASSQPVGTVVYFRMVGLNTPWSGGQTYTATPIPHAVNPSIVISTSQQQEAQTMFEVYTEIGMGREPTANPGRPVVASRKINATVRPPLISPEYIVWGGYRGVESPVLATHGKLNPYTFPLTVEATPQLMSLLLCLLMGTPTTTGASDPYTHTFSPAGSPRTGTIWQKLHYASDESGSPPVFAGYGGLVASALTLNLNPAGGGVLTVDLELQGLTYIMHSNESAVGMGSGTSFFSGRPFTINEASLIVKDSAGNNPSWMGEITALRLTLRRGVYPKWQFGGKRIAQGWRTLRRVVVAELSLDVYRVGAKPMKLVLGNSETAPYPLVPSENVQIYDPSSGHALQITLAYSDNSSNRKMDILIPKMAWVAHTMGGGGDNPDFDTYTLMPLMEGSSMSNLDSIVVVNDVQSPWTDDTAVSSLPTSAYLP